MAETAVQTIAIRISRAAVRTRTAVAACRSAVQVNANWAPKYATAAQVTGMIPVRPVSTADR